MDKDYKIGFAGTDGRTLLSAIVVSTATSEIWENSFKGVVIRGTSSMPKMAKIMNWPIEFLPTRDNSVEAYAETIVKGFREGKLDYVVPMPEALLFNGLVDILEREGFGNRVVGLTKEGSFIEGDKVKCKYLCKEANVPVADEWCVVDARSYKDVLKVSLEYIHKYGGVVLKYPYSAGGKGARIVLNTWEIKEVYDTLISDYKKSYKQMFKREPWPLLIESRMSGVEISFTIFVDKEGHFQILPTAMDYPERFSGPASKDNPITGGMGSISPHPFETKELIELVSEEIAKPLIAQMKKDNILRPCVLYPGCFVSFTLDAQNKIRPIKIRVCEVNIRPGEPEFQPVIRRIRNLGTLIKGMFDGNLHEIEPEVRDNQISICVALVTGPGGPDGQRGYPWSVTKNEPVEIDFNYLKKRNIQLIPSAMGYSDEKGFYSDGTRVAYLNSNAEIKDREKIGEIAQKLKNRLMSAFINKKVRVIPRENPQGNRLALREDIGDHFKKAQEIMKV